MNYAKQTDVPNRSLVVPDMGVGTAITPENSSKQTLRFDFHLTFLKGSLFSLRLCQVTHNETKLSSSAFR